MRIIFMGTPEFAVPSLEALREAGYEIVAVYAQPDKPVGRGQRQIPSAVKRVAESYGLPMLQPPTLKRPEEKERIAELRPDVIVVAAFGEILPLDILQIPLHGCLNVHPSLLPRHRGASPIASAILSGDKVTGVSIMLMDKGMDTGPVLTQERMPMSFTVIPASAGIQVGMGVDSRRSLPRTPIRGGNDIPVRGRELRQGQRPPHLPSQSLVSISMGDTTASLTEQLSHLGAKLLVETLPPWVEGKIIPQAQDNREATYSRIITKQDGEMDWHLSAIELERRVRAFQPWPGCYTRWQGKLLKVIAAVPFGISQSGKPGQVVNINLPCPKRDITPLSPPLLKGDLGGFAGVQTCEGILGLLEIQLEGKKPLKIEDFCRGQKEFIGSLLPSSPH